MREYEQHQPDHFHSGFLNLLGLVFIILKLTGVIDWSWLWVLAPIWGQFAFFGVVLMVVLVCGVIAAAVKPKSTVDDHFESIFRDL